VKLTDPKELFLNFRCHAPATAAALRKFEHDSEFRLPEHYVQFLQQMNGGEGFIGSKAYLILWPVEELLPMNKAYEVGEYAPDLFLFGSNGGGEAYAFDRHSNDSIVVVPFVGMDSRLAQYQAATFTEFIEHLHKS
jgi:hypothetical protein